MVHTQYTIPGTPTLLIIPTHLAFPEVKHTPEERVLLRTPSPENKTKNKTKQKITVPVAREKKTRKSQISWLCYKKY